SLFWWSGSVEFPPGRRSGLHVHQHAAAKCRLPATDRSGFAASRENPREYSRSPIFHQRRRIQPIELRANQLQRVLLRYLEAVGRQKDKSGAVSGGQSAFESRRRPASE